MNHNFLNWMIKNIWENNFLVNWLSAVGTVGAVCISLWLSRDKRINKKIEGNCFDYQEKQYFVQDSNIKNELVDNPLYVNFTNYCGYIRLYNASDYPKTLYDLKIVFEFDDKKEKNIEDRCIKFNDKIYTYVSLSPKDTIVLSFKTSIDFNNDGMTLLYENPSRCYMKGLNEMNQEVKIVIPIKNYPNRPNPLIEENNKT